MLTHLHSYIFTVIMSFVGITNILWPIHTSAKWYNGSPIVHACGQYRGAKKTNCKEALIQTLESSGKGRTIEIDFSFTSDDVLVCLHNFNDYNRRVNHVDSSKRASLKSFKKAGTAGGGTAMTAEEAIKIMAKYPKAYLVVDTKEKGVSVYKRLVKICKRIKRKSFLNRMVIQVYSENGYKKIRKVYKFKHWCLSGYKYMNAFRDGYNNAGILKTLVTYSKMMKFEALIIPARTLARNTSDINMKNFRIDPKKIKAISNGKKIPVLCHTVNSYKDYITLRHNGITNVYTDFY